jgi:hypothetical protein
MAKGGHREGAGRPVGRKDSGVRHKKRSMPVASKDPNPNLPSRAINLNMEKYLSANNRKMYRALATKFESPSECLKAIRDDLVARYNMGRIGEMEEVSHIRKMAKDGIEEIEKTGKLHGKELTDVQKLEEIAKLKKQSKAYPQLSSKVTSLAGEIRQINELIDRIESGRPDKVINLFNILDGRADKNKTERLRKEIFTLPEEEKPAEQVEEGEIVPNNEEEQTCNDLAEAHMKEQEALEEKEKEQSNGEGT